MRLSLTGGSIGELVTAGALAQASCKPKPCPTGHVHRTDARHVARAQRIPVTAMKHVPTSRGIGSERQGCTGGGGCLLTARGGSGVWQLPWWYALSLVVLRRLHNASLNSYGWNGCQLRRTNDGDEYLAKPEQWSTGTRMQSEPGWVQFCDDGDDPASNAAMRAESRQWLESEDKWTGGCLVGCVVGALAASVFWVWVFRG